MRPGGRSAGWGTRGALLSVVVILCATLQRRAGTDAEVDGGRMRCHAPSFTRVVKENMRQPSGDVQVLLPRPVRPAGSSTVRKRGLSEPFLSLPRAVHRRISEGDRDTGMPATGRDAPLGGWRAFAGCLDVRHTDSPVWKRGSIPEAEQTPQVLPAGA